MPLLSETELATALESMPGWGVEEGRIAKTFSFPTYAHGLLFASACGHLAERMDHHPDLLVTWRKVDVALSTHSAGGVTEKDVMLAKEFDALAG